MKPQFQSLMLRLYVADAKDEAQLRLHREINGECFVDICGTLLDSTLSSICYFDAPATTAHHTLRYRDIYRFQNLHRKFLSNVKRKGGNYSEQELCTTLHFLADCYKALATFTRHVRFDLLIIK